MKKVRFNQKYWKEQYYNKNIIKQCFKDYLTYCPMIHHLNIEQKKQEFLQGEKKEILEIIEDKKEQEKIYKFVEKVICEIKE